MKKSVLAGILSFMLLTLFTCPGICEQNKKTGQAPQKIGVLERIKKAYTDFQNRDKKKEIKKAEAAKPKTPPKAKPDMTKDEILADLKDNLKMEEGIFDTLPGLKAQKDKDGKIFYTYNSVRLEDMGKEDLEKLSGRVGQTAVKLRTERIQQQLKVAGQAQRAGAGLRGQTPAGSAVPKVPPQPPRVLTASPAPRTPSAPPAVPARR